MSLKNIHVGWGWLDTTLNRVIDTINANQVIPSATVAVQQTPTGTLLTVTGQQATSDSPTGGQWITITVYDANCNAVPIQVWGKT